MLRTIGIWVFGLLASAIIGAMIGAFMGALVDGDNWWFYGFWAGLFGFACIRLWLGPRQD